MYDHGQHRITLQRNNRLYIAGGDGLHYRFPLAGDCKLRTRHEAMERIAMQGIIGNLMAFARPSI